MHDFSLGGPVDEGAYCGYYYEGEPLHSGNCEDGVYGCRKCSIALRSLPESAYAELALLDPDTGELTPDRPSLSQQCDWCNRSVHITEISGVRPWDEPSCYYEVCDSCYSRYHSELRKMEELWPESDHEDDDYYDHDYDEEDFR